MGLPLVVLAALTLSSCSSGGDQAAPDPRSSASETLADQIGAEATAGGGGTARPEDAGQDGRWTLVIADLSIGEVGVGFGVHPTTAPIVVQADAAGALEVCPADPNGRGAEPGAGTSFGNRWRSGCLTVGTRPTSLPRTDGRTHVGFRIVSATREPVEVRALRIRWICADDQFVLQPWGAHAETVVVRPDCDRTQPG